jgi:hypothetical protein
MTETEAAKIITIKCCDDIFYGVFEVERID